MATTSANCRPSRSSASGRSQTSGSLPRTALSCSRECSSPTAVVIHGALRAWRAREWVTAGRCVRRALRLRHSAPCDARLFQRQGACRRGSRCSPFSERAPCLARLTPPRGVRARVATAALVAYAGLALYSSALALRGAHVRSTDRGPDLAAFRSIVGDEPTLNLGRDNYAGWDLRASDLSGFQSFRSGALRSLEERAEKSAGDSDPPRGGRGLDRRRSSTTFAMSWRPGRPMPRGCRATTDRSRDRAGTSSGSDRGVPGRVRSSAKARHRAPCSTVKAQGFESWRACLDELSSARSR